MSDPSRGSTDRANKWATALWAAIFVGLPLFAASFGVPVARTDHRATLAPADAPARPSPPPAVEPLEVLKIAPVEARAINAAIPFSIAPNRAARPFTFIGDAQSRARATDCLAAAQLYEAGDTTSGQEAVAQVVINRMHHPAFPKTICGVVFQGAERTTGCQFTFTCDGALARTPSPKAWERARMLAGKMLSGQVDDRVGLATHYHTNWVVPYWSGSLDKITLVDNHLFFRWKGWWGTPAAFHARQEMMEPVIARLAFLSSAHAALVPAPNLAGGNVLTLPDFSDLARPAVVIGRDRIGHRFGPARLAAINATGDAFVMLLDRGISPEALDALAHQICSGRTKCRLLGWTRPSDIPSSFPIDDKVLGTMSYAYLRAVDSKLERSLYNCREFPGQPKGRCMRERLPVAATSLPTLPPPASTTASKIGTETIRLTR